MNIMDRDALSLFAEWIYVYPSNYIPKTGEYGVSPNFPLFMEQGKECVGMSSDLQKENPDLREQTAARKK